LKRIIISVTNDLVADQRVHRVVSTLHDEGAKLLLVGRMLQKSEPIIGRKYSTHRMRIPINKGPLFYAFYNIWLFFFILFHKADGLVSNDLDTLPANYLASKIKRVPLVFDSHEYFPEVPELVHRPKIKTVWLKIEKLFLPKIKFGYTVCESIANIYKEKYGIQLSVVRNLPFRKKNETVKSIQRIGNGKKVIIYQGALNIGRGIELMMDTIQFLDNVVFVIAGGGDIAENLKIKAEKLGLKDKIIFLGRMQLDELHQYTLRADLGMSLEENLGLNYYYALPNKLFDYIQAQVPVIVSDFPEMSKVVREYNIGLAVDERNPEKLATIISEMLANDALRLTWKDNLKKASEELCWENERNVLIEIYGRAGLLEKK
jgi:glycosyltransferase involved in cell wall biosynthesis